MKYIQKLKNTGVLRRFVFRCLASLLVLSFPFSALAYEKVRLQLKWQHHFQFAGYYAAKAQGYYQAAGLDVEFLTANQGDDTVQKVLDGKAEFGVGSTDLLLRREEGAPVVALAVIFQHSPLALMTLKQNGTDCIHHLAGSKIMIEPGSCELQAYLRNEGVSPDKCTMQTPKFHGGDLLAGSADAVSTHVIGEAFPLRKAGKEYKLYSPRSVGIDFYGDNLFTTESQIRMNPDMVRAFRAASLKGWEYAVKHTEETVLLIHSHYSHGHSLEHLRFEAHQMEPLLQASLVEIGHMNPGRWHHIAEIYAGLGMMKSDFDLKGFLYDSKPQPQDLRLIYAILAAALALVLIASMIAVRFSRLSATLKKTLADNKQVGDALQESESLYRSILNASPDGIAIMDGNGGIRMISPAGVAMFGYEREEELLGHNIIEYISPEDMERAASNIQNMLQGTFPGVGDYRAVRADGSKFDIETKGQLIMNGDGLSAGTVFMIRDISERKQASNSCLVAMGEMICAIAHQWRQPLATLGMIVQRAHAVGNMKGLTGEYLDEFKTNAMRQIKYMSDTIEEFRGFYRPEKQKMPFSPLSCINDAVKLFEPQFTSACISVDVTCRACEEQVVDGFPNEFKQVVLNLLGNARDAILESRASKEGEGQQGRIKIEITIREDNTMNIDFSDNGCGIAPEIAPRILDPYFTTKEESGGSGLGLYMSRMIVEKSLGGILRLVQCQEGATFRIELPLEKTLCPA